MGALCTHKEIIWLLFAAPLGFPSKIAEAPEGSGVPSRFSETPERSKAFADFQTWLSSAHTGGSCSASLSGKPKSHGLNFLEKGKAFC